MFKRLRISLYWLIIFAVFAPSTYAAPSQQLTDQIRIGVMVLPNSDADLGAKLAVSELNARALVNFLGETMQFELVYSNQVAVQPEDMPRALEALNGQEVHAILGPSENRLALPNLEPLARAGVPGADAGNGGLPHRPGCDQQHHANARRRALLQQCDH